MFEKNHESSFEIINIKVRLVGYVSKLALKIKLKKRFGMIT